MQASGGAGVSCLQVAHRAREGRGTLVASITWAQWSVTERAWVGLFINRPSSETHTRLEGLSFSSMSWSYLEVGPQCAEKVP